MKKYFIVLLSFFILSEVLSQEPNWTVDESNFEYTMTFQCFLNVNGTTLKNENDVVGAFVNNECRGVANLVYVQREDKYYAFLTVYADSDAEDIRFKIYNSESNEIVNIENVTTFEIGGHYGNSFQAFSIASPALNKKADVISFGFEGLTSFNQDNGSEIKISLSDNADIASLVTIFELSPGATLYYDSHQLQSGESSLDFSENNTKQLTILSQDQSTLRYITAHVNVVNIENETRIYKKDKICDYQGVIKVKCPIEGAEIVLYSGNKYLDTVKISNGEATFYDLNEATYRVEIESFEKEIEIVSIK